MARKLHYRLVEVRVDRGADGCSWQAYVLIHGQGKALRGFVADSADLWTAMESAIARAFEAIVGSPLPDTAR